MANVHSMTILTLHGDNAPIEVDVQPQGNGIAALSAVVQWKDARITVVGYPNDVEAFFKNGLDLVQEAAASLTPCQRRGKHNYEPSGPEDGCADCEMEPLAAPVLVSNGSPI